MKHVQSNIQEECPMIMEGSEMSKTDLKDIMHSAYNTPRKLCNINGNLTIQQPRLPPNNTDDLTT